MLKQFCVRANFQPFGWDKMRMQTQKSVQDLEQYPCPMLTPVCPKHPSLGRIKTNSLEHHIVIHQITPNYHLSALREPCSFLSHFLHHWQTNSACSRLSIWICNFSEEQRTVWCLLVSGASNLLTALRAAHQHPTLKANIFGFLTGFCQVVLWTTINFEENRMDNFMPR